MLNEVKHPYWIPRYARNDTEKVLAMTHSVMLNEVKHPYWIPRYARNDTEKVLAMTKERYGAVQQNLHSFVNRLSSLAYLSSIIFLVCKKVCDAPCAVRR